VQQFIDGKEHPEQAYRACLGLLNLSNRYGNERLEKACKIGLAEGLRYLKNIRNILTSKRDQLPSTTDDTSPSLNQHHENVRGADHYH